MRNLLFLLNFLLLFKLKSFAIKQYNKGDELYVWSSTGINCRAVLNIKSQIICMLDYGTKVEIVEDNKKQFPFEVTVPKVDSMKIGFKLEVFWVKIRTKNNKIGFIADTYLSKMFPFIRGKEHFESEINYLIRVYGKPRLTLKNQIIDLKNFTIRKKLNEK